MSISIRIAVRMAGAILVLGQVAAADEGMWLLTNPPADVLRQRYGFEPSREWLEHLQKSAVRIGASGAVISPEGLVLTNHHVGVDQLAKLSTPQRDLVQMSFYARTREEELKCPDQEVQILWSIEDVTAKVNAAVKPEQTPAQAAEARRQEMSRIEAASKEATGLTSQVVTLYHGARYHLYRYKRYDDVRLVFAPEQAIAYFGGDTDNFEYPRFDLDCCFFRIYENGKPLHSEHYLKWSRAGASEGEPVFVLGHPGHTDRLLTVNHLEFIRDVVIPTALRGLWREEVKLATFCNENAEYRRMGQTHYFGVQNGRKARDGGYSGLLDPEVFKAKKELETKLREHAKKSAGSADKADPWTRVAAAEQTFRSFYPRYRVLREGWPSGSELFGIARTVVRLAEELPKPSPERLREYRDSELESVYLGLYSPAPIYEEFEIERVTSGLSLLAEALGADDPLVVAAFAGKDPAGRAAELVRGCTLKDIETRKRMVKEGKAAIEASKDPMIRLAVLLDPETRALRKRYEDEVESVERECYAKIGAVRFDMFGESVYPDATGTLRLAFGAIRGYEQNGQKVPAFTTFAGLYQRSQERGNVEPFKLPAVWAERRERLSPATPMNFSFTADIIGGNSGSPVVNKNGEYVGLVFDGNIQSLLWDYAFDEKQGRSIAVDARALLEALEKVYDASPLVKEITGGR
jgi:hypothetical protein